MNINSFNFNRFVHPRSGFLQETFVFVEACCASDGWLIHVTIFLFTRTAGSYKGWFGWFNRMEVLVHPQEWFCRSLLCERLVVHTRDDFLFTLKAGSYSLLRSQRSGRVMRQEKVWCVWWSMCSSSSMRCCICSVCCCCCCACFSARMSVRVV